MEAEIKTTEAMYIILSPEGNYQLSSLAFFKKWCISNWVRESREDWAAWRKNGWKCVKVYITISPTKLIDDLPF